MMSYSRYVSHVSWKVSVSQGMFEEIAKDAIETKTQTARVLDKRNTQVVQPLQPARQTGKGSYMTPVWMKLRISESE